MPPKRKAPAAGGGPAKKNRSAASTPKPKAGSSTPNSTPAPSRRSSRDVGGSDSEDSEFKALLDAKATEGEVMLINKTQKARAALEGLSLETIARNATQNSEVRKRDSAAPLFETMKGQSNDFSYMSLKPDHVNRPLYISPRKGLILLENFHTLSSQAQDFLTTIAEPVSRPTFIHEYKLTQHSLYAAVSVGLSADTIINTLDRFLKTGIPPEVITFVKHFTSRFGKVKLVLKNTKYYLESSDPAVLQKLLRTPAVAQCRLQMGSVTSSKQERTAGVVIPGTKTADAVKQATLPARENANGENGNASKDPAEPDVGDEEEEDVEEVFKFEVPDENVETVLNTCLEIGFPVLEEYDFRNDTVNATLDIDLRPNIRIRYYQEKSLSKMFGSGRAKSGIIVLPCGAGKTLVGITAACTIKKGVIVLCTSAMSAVQWRAEAIKFTNISPDDVTLFTAESKNTFAGNTGIIVTTYSMITMSRERAHDSRRMMDFISQREWGLMLLDEVHVVPANIFRKVISNIKTHCKLGLTATLLREDDKIEDLNFLIGPKLYEANWMELSEQGHIAKVQCAEVWCPMSPEFYDEYLDSMGNHRKQELLYAMNPVKFMYCQFLINYHESRGDKIIVFSDNIYALREYAMKMGKAFIYGDTPQNERLQVLENFQHNPLINTLFLSKIGDTSLDLPEATVLIQISSQYGSRRQEAQRLGRILRAKRRNDEGFNAFFYSLVSTATNEMHYSSRRQAFLVNQGYAFKVITELTNVDGTEGLLMRTPEERRESLQRVLLESEKTTMKDTYDDIGHKVISLKGRNSRKGKANAKRTAGGLKDLSGGQDMAYMEGGRQKKMGGIKKGNEKSGFFKKVDRDKERRKQLIAEEPTKPVYGGYKKGGKKF